MKTKKIYREFLQLSTANLQLKLIEFKKEYFVLRCKKTVGQINDTSTLSKIRKNTARVKTILSQKFSDESNAESKK